VRLPSESSINTIPEMMKLLFTMQALLLLHSAVTFKRLLGMSGGRETAISTPLEGLIVVMVGGDGSPLAIITVVIVVPEGNKALKTVLTAGLPPRFPINQLVLYCLPSITDGEPVLLLMTRSGHDDDDDDDAGSNVLMKTRTKKT